MGIDIQIGNWNFDNGVAECFEDHVRKSIPGYALFEDYIVQLSTFFLSKDGTFLDIGCSTGELTEAIYLANQHKGIDGIAIDNSREMYSKIVTRFIETPTPYNIECEYGNAAYFKFYDTAPLDFIVASLTLQFMSDEDRRMLLKNCSKSLTSSGAMVVVEKVYQETGSDQDMFDVIYQRTKHTQGLSGEELFHKTQSLAGVLKPYTVEQNENMFRDCGFKSIVPFFQLGCFKGWILRI